MQELLHRLRRRALFFRVPPRMPARSAAASIQTAGVSICACVFPKAVSRARKQTAKQQPATASAAGQPLPGRMLRSQKASEKNRRKADAAGRRRDLILIDHTAEHESCPQRRQGQKRCAGDGKALQNCSQETSVPEFCFHVFSPPLPKGMICPDRKRTG